MLRSAIPTRFQLPWAKNAGGAYVRTVPVASQIGIQDGAASYSDGFPPDCFSPLSAGGVPPFGQDMNGVMNATTTWDQWYQAGAPIPYDATFAAAVGGYPQGAILDSAVVLGAQWYSIADNNSTDPDSASAANWAAVGTPTGTPVPSLTPTVPVGYVTANALTIGNGASNATNRANSDTWPLFFFIWQVFSNSSCPIFTNAGVASVRGANPAADYAANKALATPNMKGLGLIGADTMGGAASTFLAGVPLTIGNTTAPGSILGENLHALTATELPPHTHSGTTGNDSPDHTHAEDSFMLSSGQTAANSGGAGFTGSNTPGRFTGGATTRHTHIFTTDDGTVGNGSHNTVHRNMVVYWNLKL